ncbi:hypothetical protein H0H81_005565 [Sphagnurus paluster]|uniref:Uncharacterized protein n=1 Tax=Sphagnurus paluster TaxID=117069 RepID=A0A9P7FY10_9AGAR|nr:hypothetical protein H0H81_005565 [Sphagnurus paluster]
MTVTALTDRVFSILPGNQPGAAALQTFPSSSATSLTWNVNIAVGTSIGLSLRDSTGAVAQSAPFTINPGSDTSCVGKPESSGSEAPTAGQTSGSGSSTPASSPSTPATTPASPTPTPTTPVSTPVSTPTSSPTTPASSSNTSAAASSTRNAAPTQAAGFGAAAAVGAAVIALLA